MIRLNLKQSLSEDGYYEAIDGTIWFVKNTGLKILVACKVSDPDQVLSNWLPCIIEIV